MPEPPVRSTFRLSGAYEGPMFGRMFRWVLALGLALTACTSEGDRDGARGSAEADSAEKGRASASKPQRSPAGTPTNPEGPASPVWPPPSIPYEAASAREVKNALRDLSVLVKKGATDPENPWALLHGITAFGPDLKAANGRPAVEVVMEYARLPAGADGPRFGARTPDNRPLSPHENLVLHTLLGAGVSLDRTFEVQDRTFTVAEMVAAAEARFERPADAHAWARQAWTLQAFFESHAPTDEIGGEGFRVPHATLVAGSLDALERLQAFLRKPHRRGRPDQLQKRKQGIYAHTCGGLHFVQAVARGASRVQDPKILNGIREQLDLVLFRYEAERVIYERVIRAKPRAELLLQVQKLKFFGHVLETFGLAVQWELFELDADTRRLLKYLAHDLVETVYALGEAYGNQDTLKVRAAQTYYDLIGDGCHAVRGLRMALEHLYGDAS